MSRDTPPLSVGEAHLDGGAAQALTGVGIMTQLIQLHTHDRVQIHLEKALAANETSKKHFHIRSALQLLLIMAESPDRGSLEG